MCKCFFFSSLPGSSIFFPFFFQSLPDSRSFHFTFGCVVIVRVIILTTPRLRAAIPYAAPPSPLTSTSMLVLAACDLPFSSHTSLLPSGIHPNLSSPWNTSAAMFRRSLSPFVAPSLCAKFLHQAFPYCPSLRFYYPQFF
jgi:hypothetical protein